MHERIQRMAQGTHPSRAMVRMLDSAGVARRGVSEGLAPMPLEELIKLLELGELGLGCRQLHQHRQLGATALMNMPQQQPSEDVISLSIVDHRGRDPQIQPVACAYLARDVLDDVDDITLARLLR